MTTTAQGYTFDLERRIDPGDLPARLAYRGNAAMGAFLMFFSVVWSGAVLFIASDIFAEPFPIYLIPFAFVAVGAGLFIAGLGAILLRIDLTIGREDVTIRARRWFRARTTVTALDDYAGVLRVRATYRRNKKTHVVWLAALPHEQRDRRVVLAASRDEAEGRRLVEDYARWLDKPALEDTADGFHARAPEDVDKSVAQLVAEGKLASGYRPGRAAPAQLRIETGPERIVISLLKGAMPLWLGTLLAGGGGAAAFAFIGYGADTAVEIAGGGFGLVVMAGVLWAVFGSLRTTRQIVLTREHLLIATLAKDATSPKVEHEIAADAIEAIRVARGPLGGLALWIDTDAGSFDTATNMPRAALDHIRDLLIAALATATESAPGADA